MIAVILFVILAMAVFYIARAVLLNWYFSEKRAGVEIGIDRCIEIMARDLREGKAVQSSNDEIRFTQDAANYYIYYFYNANDSYPLQFNQSSYEIRKAALTGGIGGAFTYNSGTVIMTDALPPPTSDLSMSGNIVTVDLTMKRGDESIRSRTQIRPRNI
jgi:hypothetical protein